MGLKVRYRSAPMCYQLALAGIQPVVKYRSYTHKGDYFGKYRFTYDPIINIYLCQQGHELTWRTTNREGYREYWREFRAHGDCPRQNASRSNPAQKKADDAPCMAGCIGTGGRVCEDKQRKTHLCLAQGSH